MLIDILFVLIAIAFLVHGFFKGFLRGILSFVTVFISIIISILLAWPISIWIQNWFDLDDRLLTTAITAVFIFCLIRLALFFLMRFIKKLKEQSVALNRIDQFLGLALGLFRFLLYSFILVTLLLIASNISLLSGITNWFLDGSHVFAWLYGWMSRLVVPIIRAITGGIL